MPFIEILYKHGVDAIVILQNAFPNGNMFSLLVSYLADPFVTFTLYIPLVVAFNHCLGADLIFVTVITEWLNIILKWILMEDRPYWWVKETSVYGNDEVPELRQTSITCETGPGSPSGHAMGFAAFTYVLMEWIIQNYVVNNSSRHYMETFWVSLVRGIFCAALALVTMSRMYVATHFPHQCLLGIFIGIVVAWILTSPNSRFSNWWRTCSQTEMMINATFLTVIVFCIYWLQRLFGIDPQWSVKLAFKWCANAQYVHVNTTPLFSLVRACGAIYGIAIASPVAKWSRHKISLLCCLTVCTSATVLFQLLSVTISKNDVIMFYVLHFMLHIVITVVYLYCIPKYLGNPVRPNDDKRRD